MATREELNERLANIIETLTDEQAEILLKAAELMSFSGPNEDWLARADAFRESIAARGVVVPDVVETINEMWEERLDDILPFEGYDEASDPAIGLVSGPTDLSSRAKEILRDEIDPRSGWTQKDKL